MRQCGLLALYEGKEYKALRLSTGTTILFLEGSGIMSVDNDLIDRNFVRYLFCVYKGAVFTIGAETSTTYRIMSYDTSEDFVDIYNSFNFKKTTGGLYFKDVKKDEVSDINYVEEDRFEHSIKNIYIKLRKGVYGTSLFKMSYPILYIYNKKYRWTIFIEYKEKIIWCYDIDILTGKILQEYSPDKNVIIDKNVLKFYDEETCEIPFKILDDLRFTMHFDKVLDKELYNIYTKKLMQLH